MSRVVFLFDVESLAKKFHLHLLNICIDICRIGILIVLYVAVYGVSTCVLVDFDLFFFFFFEVTRQKSATRCFLFGHCFPSMCCLIAGDLTAGGTTYSFKIISMHGSESDFFFFYLIFFLKEYLNI